MDRQEKGRKPTSYSEWSPHELRGQTTEDTFCCDPTEIDFRLIEPSTPLFPPTTPPSTAHSTTQPANNLDLAERRQTYTQTYTHAYTKTHSTTYNSVRIVLQ